MYFRKIWSSRGGDNKDVCYDVKRRSLLEGHQRFGGTCHYSSFHPPPHPSRGVSFSRSRSTLHASTFALVAIRSATQPARLFRRSVRSPLSTLDHMVTNSTKLPFFSRLWNPSLRRTAVRLAVKCDGVLRVQRRQTLTCSWWATQHSHHDAVVIFCSCHDMPHYDH